MKARKVMFRVNGRAVMSFTDPRVTLADVLRDELRLTGTHLGCEQGVCGACTVLLDGKSVRSCLLLAVQADGHDVTTVEGLRQADGALNAIQQAFLDGYALQCGFCTPGFLMAAMELLADSPNPTQSEIRSGLAGNICRCTGYQAITDAVMEAVGRMAKSKADT